MKLHKHFYVAIIILACSATLGEVYFRGGVGLDAGDAVPLNQPLSTIPKRLPPWKRWHFLCLTSLPLRYCPLTI